MRRWALGCLVVVIAGVAALGWSSLPVIPDCDGLSMGPDDRCVVLEGGIGGGEGVVTYEEAVDGERRSQAAARVVGWTLVVGGVAAFVLGAVAKRWDTAQRSTGRRGPEAIARQVEEADLGDHVCTACVLVADGRRVELRARPEDRSTLNAMSNLVAAARSEGRSD